MFSIVFVTQKMPILHSPCRLLAVMTCDAYFLVPVSDPVKQVLPRIKLDHGEDITCELHLVSLIKVIAVILQNFLSLGYL